jgi:Mce-associated membrane protein
MPPASRRSTGIRRPRVAGHAAPGTEVLEPPAKRASRHELPDEHAAVEAPEGTQTVVEPEAPTDGPVQLDKPVKAQKKKAQERAQEKASRPKKEKAPRGSSSLRSYLTPPTSTRALAIWGAAALVLVALAAYFGTSWYNATYTGPATNKALVDIGATAQASQQVSDDVKTIYSFDYQRLDQNEKDARAVITPEFGAQFDKLFADVRARAPQQQAVVTATVANSAVRELDGDHAVLVLFMDQIATRANPDNTKGQIASSGRLTVTAQFLDGRWKVADVKAL